MALTYHLPLDLMEKPVEVLLLGVGGTGGEMLDALTRLHFGLKGTGHPYGLRVLAVDGDTVSASNIGRQRFSPADVGQPKSTTLVHRINLFYGLNWRASYGYGDSQDIGNAAPDLLITAVDRASVRAEIGRDFADSDFEGLWLDLGNDRHDGQCVLGHLGGRPEMDHVPLRLPNVYDLYPELDQMNDEDGGPSCSLAEALTQQDLFINRWVADAGAALLWNLLRHGRLEHHGALVNVHTGVSTPLPISPDNWACYGYQDSLAP